MAAYGGFSPAPRRMGGGKPRSKSILDSLASVRGSAFITTDRSKLVYLELLSIARAISAAWGTNQRLGSLWDARRMDASMLPRWEAIFGLAPAVTDTLVARRARIAKLQASVGRASLTSALAQPLSDALGPVFGGLEFITPANAVVHSPDASYPWGTVAIGSPWYSTVAHILIRVVKPAGYSEADFYSAVAQVSPVMDAYAPAYVTYDWYRAPTTGTPITVAGGPSAAGFYLDETNLDNEVFDS